MTDNGRPKVVELRAVKSEHEPDADQVQALEEALADVKAGRIRAFALATVKAGGLVGSRYDFGTDKHPAVAFTLLAAVDIMAERLRGQFDARAIESDE